MKKQFWKIARIFGFETPKFWALKIKNGTIHYKIYQQDGTMQPMTCKDTIDNRYFVEWVQQFDRYTVV